MRWYQLSKSILPVFDNFWLAPNRLLLWCYHSRLRGDLNYLRTHWTVDPLCTQWSWLSHFFTRCSRKYFAGQWRRQRNEVVHGSNGWGISTNIYRRELWKGQYFSYDSLINDGCFACILTTFLQPIVWPIKSNEVNQSERTNQNSKRQNATGNERRLTCNRCRARENT